MAGRLYYSGMCDEITAQQLRSRRPRPFVMVRLVAILPVALAACVAPPRPPASCPHGAAECVTLMAFFGRNAGGVERVSEGDWGAFLAAELLPRLGGQAGATVLDARGSWGVPTESERTKLVILVVGRSEAEAWRQALDGAIAAYRSRFAQHSVGVTITPTCLQGFAHAG